MNQKVISGALISGIINGLINGVIKWFSFKEYEFIPISVDSITNDELTVLGNAVHLALTLAMILTFIAFYSIKKDRRPAVGKRIWLTLKHGFFTFGVVTALSVMWQYYMGTIMVGPMTATIIVGFIAALVSMIVNYLTIAPHSEANSE